MLNVKETEHFIEYYEHLYFAREYNKEELMEKLLRKRINSTKKCYEETIIDKLNKGQHDADVIAWKLGVYKGESIYDGIVKAYRIYNLNNYLNYIEKNKEDIVNRIKVALNIINDNSMESIKIFTDIFRRLKKKAPDGFGIVYFINSVFFLSQGAVPIYDKNVYRAVQALYLDKSPNEVKVSEAPNSNNFIEASFRLVEYMMLLKEVFEDISIKSDKYVDMNSNYYISRGLDRALWVYGQSNKKYGK